MTRSRTSQTKHDRTVQAEATRLKNQDYKVKADVKGFPRPDTVRGYRPDVVATKGRERKIIEVETPDSVDSARDRGTQRCGEAYETTPQRRCFRFPWLRGRSTSY